jgi:DNA transposition AAA+ family ATPase
MFTRHKKGGQAVDRSSVPEWTSKFVAKLHKNRVTQLELAKEAGVNASYVSLILSGNRTPCDGERKLEDALQRIIENRGKENNNGKVQH